MTNDIKLYDDRVCLTIPFEFIETEKFDKYFSSAKPDFLYVDEGTDALVSITHTLYDAGKMKIDERINEYCELYKRSVPNFANFSMAKKKTKSGKDIAAFYYTSTSPERDLYNFFVLSTLDSRELVFTLHCNIENVPNYGVKFMNILNSIDILE